MQLESEKFLGLNNSLFDVRSPSEFAKGHIPNSLNLPLLSDTERALIGTIYKNKGKKEAIEKSLEFIGPKLVHFISHIKGKDSEKQQRLTCFRGGMRSSSMAWLFDLYGMKCVTLKGGYKAYRQWVLRTLEKSYNLICLGGKTGSSKTEILHELEKVGEQVLDLEKLANHRGSSFGSLGQKKQPTTEQFENNIAMQLYRFDLSKVIWIEDESKMIGTCRIHHLLHRQIQNALMIEIEKSIEERIEHLCNLYGGFSQGELIKATLNIQKKIGSQRLKETLRAINSNQFKEAVRILLTYYDAAYSFYNNKNKRDKIILNPESLSIEDIAKLCQDTAFASNLDRI